MKQANYSLSPFWDKRAIDAKTKMGRVMLTVNLNRQQFRITLSLKSTKEDFEKAVSAARVLNDSSKELRKEINDYVAKAEIILNKIKDPSKETFIRLFKSDTDLITNNKTNVAPFFNSKIAELHKEERFSSSVNVKLALSSLSKYKKDIFFEDIDMKFLKGYISFMVANGNSVTTANIYLRALRTIFNEVVKAGIVSEKHYHFRELKIGSRVKSKAVLYPADLKALLDYKTIGVRETRAKAYFFFCYLSNGMNARDMFMLKWKNIQGNMITFMRHKTRNSTTNGQKEIKVYLHDLSKAIIKEWGNKLNNTEEFVFPVCTNKMTGEQMNKAITRYKRVSNKMLASIGKKLGFEVHLCLHLARHSFANKMKLDNVNVSAISDAMGHTTTATTENYLHSLPDLYIKEMSSSLLEFDTPKMLAI